MSVISLVMAAAKSQGPDHTGQYILNRLAAQGAIAVTQPVAVDPGSVGVHNDLGSLGFTNGKVTVGNAGALPLDYQIAANKPFVVRFNLRPSNQNLSVLLGDLVNNVGYGSWFVVLNRATALPACAVEFDLWNSSTNSVFSCAFAKGTKLAANAWSDVIISRTAAGVISCSINGVTASETYTFAGAVAKRGTGLFTVGRTADTDFSASLPYLGMLNDLYIKMDQ